MNRAELERLDREALVLHAEAAGVTRARILTRAELVDELVLRTTVDQAARQKARGLFGRARDLLARVVEQGLHLPDAADRIRALGGAPLSRPSAPAALPTLTLAEIYAAQGHRARAIETLERVLSREPEHAAGAALLAQLRDSTFPVPPPRMPPEESPGAPPRARDAAAEEEPEEVLRAAGERPRGARGTRLRSDRVESTPDPGIEVRVEPRQSRPDPSTPEPSHMLDDAPLPPRYDVDECVAIPVDTATLYVYWEVRARTLDYVGATRAAGVIALRVVVIEPTWDGPRSATRDHDVHSSLGDFFVRDLPAGCVVRVAIGVRQGDTFVSIAHSPALETPAGVPAPVVADTLVRWSADGSTGPLSHAMGPTSASPRVSPDAAPRTFGAHRPRRGPGGFIGPELENGGAAGDRASPLGSSERWAERT
jgi:hypothetical protein